MLTIEVPSEALLHIGTAKKENHVSGSLFFCAVNKAESHPVTSLTSSITSGIVMMMTPTRSMMTPDLIILVSGT